ncbi:hypothetical protein GOP47_0019422 [Adiantum capillus-veneris]|uniref:Uncharacterized protein n=1 Tax=Adiantum capillus-veneris TaxID=13818 RepID=A0A9D4UBG5_ADICA|nr:hypothetical protein GOP47_0019422 [Adiantum capillus-veneris]
MQYDDGTGPVPAENGLFCWLDSEQSMGTTNGQQAECFLRDGKRSQNGWLQMGYFSPLPGGGGWPTGTETVVENAADVAGTPQLETQVLLAQMHLRSWTLLCHKMIWRCANSKLPTENA